MRASRSAEDSLDFCSKFLITVHRFVNSKRPWLTGWIHPITEDFSDVYKHVAYSDAV